MPRRKTNKIINHRKSALPIQTPNLQETDIACKIERNKYVYDLVNRWIENADNKVSISCGLFTGVFGVVMFLSERYIRVPENARFNRCLTWPYRVCFVLSLILMLSALIFYAKAILPNLNSDVEKLEKKKQKKKKKAKEKKKELKAYPIFYADIQDMDYLEYKKRMDNGTEAAFNDELLGEIMCNSQICAKKIKNYRRALILSFVSIILAMLTLLVHYIMIC